MQERSEPIRTVSPPPADVNPLNLEIQFSKIDLNDLEYEGSIQKNKQLLKPGAYDLIVMPNGKIKIMAKTEQDR